MSTPATAAPAAQTTPPTQTSTATPVVTPAAPVTPPTETPTAKRVAGAFFKSFGLPDPTTTPPAQSAPPATPPASPPPAEPPKDEKPKTEATKEDKPKEEKPKKEKVEVGDPQAPLPPRRRSEELNVRELVKESVQGAMEAMKPKPVEEPKVELPIGIARKVEALRVLEQEDKRFKGVSKSVEDFYKPGGLQDKYKADWLKANPGKKFDREDSAHDDWYAENDPLTSRVTEDDLEAARDLLIEQRATEKAERRIAKIEEKQTVEAQKATVIERAKQELNDFALDSISAFSTELAEKAKKPEQLASLDKDDPLAEHLLTESVKRVAPLVEAVVEIFGTNRFDKNNPNHLQVDTLGGELEAQLLAMGDQAARNGRPYMPMQEYDRLPATKKKLYWTIGEKDLLQYIRLKEKNQTAGLYQRLRPKVVTNSTPAAASTTTTPAPAPAVPAAPSPSVSSAPSAPPPGSASSAPPARTGHAFFSSFGVR